MAYTRVNWEDLPSTNTPINATNLNNMDAAIKENDDKLTGVKGINNPIYANDFRCKNMFNPANRENYVYIDTDGSRKSNGMSFNSRYIKVEPSTDYVISGRTSWTTEAYYTSNKTFISRGSGNQFTTPSNCEYIIMMGTPSEADSIQLEPGTTATTFVPHKAFGETNYTLFEQVVGTWLDGKPLYRRTYQTTTPSSENAASWVQNISNLNFDYINIVGGNIYDTSNFTSPLNNFISTSNFSSCWIGRTDKAIEMIVVGSARVSKTCYITVEYTKTTD